MDDLERRWSGEIRVDVNNGKKLTGYAIVFNQQSVDLGGFREIILPEAVDRTLSEALDVRALVDHDTGKIIGRTRAGTLTLRKDRKGLRAEIDPADTTAGRDILESVRRGDVSGMSFAFRTLTDDWHLEEGQPIREVQDMIVREVSIVTFPAYEQTSIDVAQRSLQAFQSSGRRSSVEWLRKVHRQRLVS
jgi:HK97 family phage prohead protease